MVHLQPSEQPTKTFGGKPLASEKALLFQRQEQEKRKKDPAHIRLALDYRTRWSARAKTTALLAEVAYLFHGMSALLQWRQVTMTA